VDTTKKGNRDGTITLRHKSTPAAAPLAAMFALNIKAAMIAVAKQTLLISFLCFITSPQK
jgi:hypothetical protein